MIINKVIEKMIFIFLIIFVLPGIIFVKEVIKYENKKRNW